MMDKKWLIGIISSILLVPALIFSRDRIAQVWASPDTIKSVDTKVETTREKLDKAYETEQKIERLILEQNARIEKNEQMDDLRARNQAEQLALIAELKKKK